jgi:branched-chain amino acid transport system ATP-binding protein
MSPHAATAGVATARAPAAAPVLEVRDVHAAYGPFRALFGVSFAVQAGRAVALLGPNGSGKTTVARVCSGLLHPTAGEVRLQGEDVSRVAPHRIARMGLVQAPEGRAVFATLTVEENLSLWFRNALGRNRVDEGLATAYEAFPRLGERRNQAAGTMSGGEQRMLSLARVLVDPPAVLVADELSLGLAPIIVDEVYRTLARIRDAGCALVVVEQQVGHALALADEAVVLAKGRSVFTGPADDLRSHAAELTLGLHDGGGSPLHAESPTAAAEDDAAPWARPWPDGDNENGGDDDDGWNASG